VLEAVKIEIRSALRGSTPAAASTYTQRKAEYQLQPAGQKNKSAEFAHARARAAHT